MMWHIVFLFFSFINSCKSFSWLLLLLGWFFLRSSRKNRRSVSLPLYEPTGSTNAHWNSIRQLFSSSAHLPHSVYIPMFIGRAEAKKRSGQSKRVCGLRLLFSLIYSISDCSVSQTLFLLFFFFLSWLFFSTLINICCHREVAEEKKKLRGWNQLADYTSSLSRSSTRSPSPLYFSCSSSPLTCTLLFVFEGSLARDDVEGQDGSRATNYHWGRLRRPAPQSQFYLKSRSIWRCHIQSKLRDCYYQELFFWKHIFSR